MTVIARATVPFPGPRWTSDMIATALMQVHFVGWEVRTMGAIVMAESLGYEWAHGLNHDELDHLTVTHLSEDHGLGGVNDYWGPKVLSPALMSTVIDRFHSFSQVAKDGFWNLRACREMFVLGALQRGYAQAFSVWSSWTNHRHEPFLAEAYAAAVRAGAIPKAMPT